MFERPNTSTGRFEKIQFLENIEGFKPELDYLYRFYQIMFPGDYILKNLLINKGIKVNRDREVEKSQLKKFLL